MCNEAKEGSMMKEMGEGRGGGVLGWRASPSPFLAMLMQSFLNTLSPTREPVHNRMTIIFSINCSDTKANSRRLKTFSEVRGTLTKSIFRGQ